MEWGRQKERETDFIKWFILQTPTTAQVGPSKSQELEINVGFYIEEETQLLESPPAATLGATARSWNGEQSWDMNPDTPI